MPKFRIQILTEGQPVRYSYPQKDETVNNTISFLMKPNDTRVICLPLNHPSNASIILNAHQLTKTIFIVESIAENQND